MIEKLILPVVPCKNETITYSKNTIIELHDRYAVFKCLYEYNDSNALIKEQRKNYESSVAKDAIKGVEWLWDREDECYVFQVTGAGSFGYNCESKTAAIELYDKFMNWLYLK